MPTLIVSYNLKLKPYKNSLFQAKPEINRTFILNGSLLLPKRFVKRFT